MTQPADPVRKLSRRVLVNIKRDTMTVTPRVVWQHELPILEAMFGEGSVLPADPATLDEGYASRATADLKPFNKTQEDFRRPSEMQGIGYVFHGDAKSEFARMKELYGRSGAEGDAKAWFAEMVYGRESEGRFAAVLGQPTLDDLPEEQLRAILRNYGYLQHVDYNADEAEKVAASKRSAEFMTLPKDKLLKAAKEFGVSLH